MRKTSTYQQARAVLILLLWVPLGLYLTQCAKVVAPTGGDKDTIPPHIRKSTPPNYSTEFNSSVIEVVFDEYIQLKEVNQKLIISPPMEKKPEVRIKGRGIQIRLEEELLPQTTYTFNFNDAIVDNNEGNPLEGYQYVLSTGDELDSLMISGKLVNALSLQPEEGAYVMLFENLNDSAPYREVPYYLGKTSKDGSFSISNIRADTFRVFGLKDMNMNYKYDQASESIAFLDSLITLPFSEDTDTTSSDSTARYNDQDTGKNFVLKLFQEEREIAQYISSSSRNQKNMLQVVFGKAFSVAPAAGNPVDFAGDSLFITEINPGRDSLTLWIRDSLLFGQESIRLPLGYETEDSAGAPVWKTDTISFRYTESRQGRKSETRPVSALPELVLIPVSKNRSTLDLNKDIVIETSMPVQGIDTSMIDLYLQGDSLDQELDYQWGRDSLRMRFFRFRTDWEPGEKYRMEVFPGAFNSYLGGTHDTLILELNTRQADYYGTLTLDITGVTSQTLIQMLGNEDKVLNTRIIEGDEKLTYSFLPPGKFRFRAVEDKNANGKWNPGNYAEKQQPERVHYYQEEINVRSNWEIELSWELMYGQLPETKKTSGTGNRGIR